MTINELIKELKKFPKDKKVWVENAFNQGYASLAVGTATMSNKKEIIIDSDLAVYTRNLEREEAERRYLF